MKKRKFLPRPDFWSHVFDWTTTGRHRVGRLVVGFTAYSLALYLINRLTPDWFELGLTATPYEVAGGGLSLMLVLRINSANERWWEARKLWGGITNQSRNLAVLALSNGPDDPTWRRDLVGWIVAFAHSTRRSLRQQAMSKDIGGLIGPDAAAWVGKSDHMPSAIALTISSMLRSAREAGTLDPFAYHQAAGQLTLLIDHLGGCERILKTPLASSIVVLIRRFIFLFFLTLPFGLIARVGWLTPLFTLLICYPILALDQIADDLQHPFSPRSINHLPIDEITATIERNLMSLLAEPRDGWWMGSTEAMLATKSPAGGDRDEP